MAAIGSVDQFNDAEMGEKCVTEMKPYTFRWRQDIIGWNGREFSVILPADTKYTSGMLSGRMPKMDKYGFFTFPSNDVIDASSGIYVLPMGKVDITFTSKTQKTQGNEIVTTCRKALVSLSLLPKNVSKEAFLNHLKKKDVQILSENENSLMTKAKTARAYGETVVKTMVSGDVVFQIKVTTYGRSSDNSLYQLLNKIRLSPQVRKLSSFKDKNLFLRRRF